MELCTIVARYDGKVQTFTLSFEDGERDGFVAGHRLTLARDDIGVFLSGVVGFKHRLRPNVLEVFDYICIPVTAILQFR